MARIGTRVRWYYLGLCIASWSMDASAQEGTPAPAPSATPPPAATPSAPNPSEDPGQPVPTSESEALSEDPTVVQAREAFRLGSILARQGQWNEALAAFERSAKLLPHPVTTYNIGYVERALGRYTRARKSLSVALSPVESAKETVLPDKLAAEARGYLAEITQRLATVTVTLPPDTAISVDGRPLEVTGGHHGRTTLVAGTRELDRPEVPPAPSFELLIDPGSHAFLLARPGARDELVRRTFEPGSNTVLELQMTESSSQAAPKPARVEADTPAEESGPDRLWTYVAYGVGGAGIAAGSVFGLLAIDKTNDCPDKRCQSEGDLDTLQTYTTLSTVGFAVGVVGVGVGTWLLLTEDPTPERAARPRTPLRLQPWFAGTSAGVVGKF